MTENRSILPVENESRIIRKYKKRIRNPLTGIRAHCVECMGGAVIAVNSCTSVNCALHPFRMGKNPYHKRGKANVEDEPDSKTARKIIKKIVVKSKR